MAEEVLLSISLIIAISAIMSIVARLIKQPPIIAYILAGILSGPLFLNIIKVGNSDSIQLFAHIGVALLLFIVGLSLDLRVLKEVGGVSLFAGFIQILITAIFGYIISTALGFSSITALYICIALSFSSTVVVVKILSDKKEIDTLHGRITLGILIVQDFVAAVVLTIIPLANNHGSIYNILTPFGKAVFLIILIFIFAHFILNKLMSYIAISQETLFLSGISWALILATIFYKMGFSLEIGALIAGMSIAGTKYNLDLGGKIKPLRDFFVVLFFVFFGSQLQGPITKNMITFAIFFSMFVFIIKPLIVMFTLRLFGYKKKINFFTGLSLGQISEFSLIILLLGFTMGHLEQNLISLTIIIAIITISLSSYVLYYSSGIFDKISHLLWVFEGKKYRKEEEKKEKYDIILFGYHRIGYKILNSLIELNIPFLVIDYNPKVVLSLSKNKIKSLYGDAGDIEFLKEIPLEYAKVIISTIPDKSSNLQIKERLNEANKNAVFLATTEQPGNALELYKKGIDYVILPHHLGGDYAAKMIKDYHTKKERYKEIGKKHQRELHHAKRNSGYFYK